MTSEEAFRELHALVKQHPEMADVGVPATEEAIAKAQEFLKISFPSSYVLFLTIWGTLSIGPMEFYGIAGIDFEHGRIPDGVWFTYTKRKQVGLPRELIVVVDNNGDEFYCVEIPSGRVVTWDAILKKTTGQKADDIFNFVLNECKEWFLH
jgi:hypothetical protein